MLAYVVYSRERSRQLLFVAACPYVTCSRGASRTKAAMCAYVSSLSSARQGAISNASAPIFLNETTSVVPAAGATGREDTSPRKNDQVMTTPLSAAVGDLARFHHAIVGADDRSVAQLKVTQKITTSHRVCVSCREI